MARLIDADAAKIRFANYREDYINEDDINAANVFADVVSELDEFPTIDPVTAAAEALGMSPDRLRELAQAEKTGQLVVLSEPMKPMVYKPNDTDVYCPSCGETLSGGWPLSDADDLRKLCQCPNCGQSIDDTRCEAAEAALDAMGGENNA